MLPARVRISRPPLPLAPALATQFSRWCPEVPLEQVQAAALAIAGGKVIGGALRWEEQPVQYLETAWRGKGIEEALLESLDQGG